ncbi:MAG: hypothetical protein JWQ09_5255 [Segetibacter sp.]|nr:hypothetical protein [Segetibacter sp.]
MKVVIDSNVFVSCLNSFSPYHYIFQALVRGDFKLQISTDIAFEYEEVFSWKFIKSKADIFFYFIKTSDNVIETQIYYNWNLITVDPDDNKFVDCFIAANADYIELTTSISTFSKKLAFLKLNVLQWTSLWKY